MKNRAIIKKEWIWTIVIFMTNIFVFFGYAIPYRTPFLLGISLFSFIYYIATYKRIYKNVIRANALWLIVLLFFCIQLLYTVSFELSLKFIMTFGATIILKIIFESLSYDLPHYNWKKILVNSALLCSGVHVMATLMYNFNPNTIINFNKMFLKNGAYLHNILQYNQGLNPGICDDYGFNAFCNLIFLGLVICKLLIYKKVNIITIFSIIAGILAIVIIGKRSHLLCLIICTLISIFISLKNIPILKKILFLILLIILGYVIYYVCLNVPATAILLKRLEQSQTMEGLLNGREFIYNYVLNVLKNNLFLGIGIRGIGSLIGDGHNIYFQILAEMGIIMGTIVFVNFILSLYRTFKEINNKNNIETKYLLLFSLFVQVFFLINGITENPFYVESILIFYLIITSFKEMSACYEK